MCVCVGGGHLTHLRPLVQVLGCPHLGDFCCPVERLTPHSGVLPPSRASFMCLHCFDSMGRRTGGETQAGAINCLLSTLERHLNAGGGAKTT